MFSVEQSVLLQHQDVKLFLVGTLHDIESCSLKGYVYLHSVSVYLSLQGDTCQLKHYLNCSTLLIDFFWVWFFLEENVGKEHTIQHIVKFKFSISEQAYRQVSIFYEDFTLWRLTGKSWEISCMHTTVKRLGDSKICFFFFFFEMLFLSFLFI